MATYSAEQLRGQGSPVEELSGNKTFTFTNPFSGSSYFTIETVRNANGFYDSSSPKNALGTYASLTNVGTLITSSYIASVVIKPGGGSFTFNPTSTVSATTSYVRATGGVTLEIT